MSATQNEHVSLTLEEQVAQIRLQQVLQDNVLSCVIQALAQTPQAVERFGQACFARIDAVAQTSPEDADVLTNYVARLMQAAIDQLKADV